jgi:hypothetical protein
VTWVLLLNDMRSPKIEMVQPVARAETKEALEAWEKSLRVPPYQDGPWLRTYPPDSALGWFNPPMGPWLMDVGTEETRLESAIASAKREWQEVLAIPEIPR